MWTRRIHDWLIVLGFNDTSTLVSHFVSSPREREKRDRRDSRGDERERRVEKEEQEWKWRNRKNNSIPSLPLPTTRTAGLAQLKVNISWTSRWHKIPDTFATSNHPQAHTRTSKINQPTVRQVRSGPSPCLPVDSVKCRIYIFHNSELRVMDRFSGR